MSKIIILTYNYPYRKREIFLHNELLYLSARFDSIHILPLFGEKKGIARDTYPNITFAEPLLKYDLKDNKLRLLLDGLFNFSPLKTSINEFFTKKVYLKKSHFKNWLSAVCITRALLKKKRLQIILKERSEDTIFYSYWGDKFSLIIPYLAVNFPNPIIARFHNSDLYENIKGGYIPFRKQLLENITTAIFISEDGEKYLKSKYQNINFNSKVFKLGVPDKGISKPSKDKVLRIASCSYLVPIKRIDLILEAINLVNFKVEWTHFGGGYLFDELYAKSKKVTNNIKINFAGPIKNDEILKFYVENPIDLFINVSKSEGVPVSIMEALSTGIPVYATDVGGTSEIVNNINGKLLPEDLTPEILSQEITAFHQLSLLDKEKKRIAARHFWESHYDADKNYNAFFDYILKLKK